MSDMEMLDGKPARPRAGDDGKEFRYTIDRFADLKVMRYRVPGWENLLPRQRVLLYYLSEAANCGRDILYAQNFKYGLLVKRVLESIYRSYPGNRETGDFKAFEVYLKRVWFSNGIHHHYACDKFMPGFSCDYFRHLMEESDMHDILVQLSALPGKVDYEENGIRLGEIKEKGPLTEFLVPVLFDPSVYAKRISLDSSSGLLESSSCNYYQGVKTQEAEEFYAAQRSACERDCPEAARHPVSYGLNTRLVKRGGKIGEQVCRIGGLYSKALEKIAECLEKAAGVAETEVQRRHILKLRDYYRSGSLAVWDEYCVQWVEDVDSVVDYTNGFIETYGDPLGLKASWEAIADFRDEEASRRTRILCRNAQWFEDHSPVDSRFKKPEVKGVSAKVINAVQLGGDCFPSAPIGINLPNSNWIRAAYGSKSVTIGNITHAYNVASRGSGLLDEFVIDDAELQRIRTYGDVTDELHTDLHECLGHGSGRLMPGVSPDALKAYGATIEEARADLFGLYYIADSKLIELELITSPEAYKAHYYTYMMNGLMTQLARIAPGAQVEEAHMRNRQLIARWALEHGRADHVVEMVVRDGKTYVRINDYEALRGLFARLLAEVQRIKSTGDYDAARTLVETYGITIDPVLHAEVLGRYAGLGIAPYKGFINPRYEAVTDDAGRITDVRVTYSEAYDEQMLRYSRDYAAL